MNLNVISWIGSFRLLTVGSLLLSLSLVVACGGSDDGSSSSTNDPTATTVSVGSGITPTATAVPRRTPTPTTEPTPESSGDDLVQQGKVLFESGAGGTGCAICHGMDAKGNQVIGAPDNRGSTPDQIYDALDRVPNMAYITLTSDEAKAISAYLQFLATQP